MFAPAASNGGPSEVRLAGPAALFGKDEANAQAGSCGEAAADPLADFLARLHFPGWRIGAIELDGSQLHEVEGAAFWFYLAIAGEFAIDVDAGHSVLLCRGDAAVVAGQSRHLLRPLARTEGIVNEPTKILFGSFAAGGMGNHPLSSVLPPTVAVASNQQAGPLASDQFIDWLAREASSPGSGSAAVVNRFLQALFMDALRMLLSSELTQSQSPSMSNSGPLQAALDPCLGSVLRLVHAKPDRDWTVHSMARESGLSRSAFADRFRTIVGQPPLQYVTEIRMQKASELLETTDIPVKRIAALVGYESVSAFSSAFKRRFGGPPVSVRRASAGLGVRLTD
jgi:AraC family transcriptional regulator, alkane utilization regulator